LKHPRSRWNEEELFLIVGSDAAEGLHAWHRFEELADVADLVIVGRPGWSGKIDTHSWPPRWRDGSGVIRVDVDPIDASSTELRGLLSIGSIPSASISEPVLHYIGEHRLYTGKVS